MIENQDDSILILRDSKLVEMLEDLIVLFDAIPAANALPILERINKLVKECPAYDLRGFVEQYGDYLKWRREGFEKILKKREKRASVKGRLRNISPKRRFSIFERDRFTCQYCGRKAPEVELHVDHIFPFSKGGQHEEANLITACKDCNLGKRDKCLNHPEDNGFVLSTEQGEILGLNPLDGQAILPKQ